MATVEELLKQAVELYKEKNYQGVIDLLPEEVLEKHKYDWLYIEKARAYFLLREYDLCQRVAEKALEVNPNNANAHHHIGNAYFSKERYEKAIEEYNKAITLNPELPYPYSNLGIVYYRLKQYKMSIEAYNRAINIDPKYSTAYYNRALTYFDQGQYKKALLDFEKKIELTKDNPDYYTSVAKEKIAEIGKLINDKAYSDINILVNKVKGVLLYKDDCITHYTGITVAKALILDKSKLRLSEGAYLNDTSEGRELFKYLHLTATPIDGHDTIAEPFAKKPFIGSFVAESKHDDLTLWRMYGKEAKEEARGCSITMRRDELITKITESLPGYKKEDASKADSEFIFYRVAYRKQDNERPFTIPSGKPEDEDLLNEYMKELAINVKDFEEKRAGNVADKQKLLELLNEIAYLFKSYDYQYEHEIRLVLKGTGFAKIVDMGFTPPKVYIELINIRPVLKKITLGPKVEKSDEWASALFYALDKDGLNPEILISHLPFK